MPSAVATRMMCRTPPTSLCSRFLSFIKRVRATLPILTIKRVCQAYNGKVTKMGKIAADQLAQPLLVFMKRFNTGKSRAASGNLQKG